jgi:hypothetical protein
MHELAFIQNLTAEKYLTSDKIRYTLHCICNDLSVEYPDNEKTYYTHQRNKGAMHCIYRVYLKGVAKA